MNTQSVSVSEEATLDSEPFTIYVRNSGDDANVGLSESEALATISEVITRIPRIGVENGLVDHFIINLGGGETFQPASELTFAFPWSPVTIASNDPANPATIECPDVFAGIRAWFTFLNLRDVHIDEADSNNPPDRVVTTELGAVLRAEGDWAIRGGGDISLIVKGGASILNDGGTIDAKSSAAQAMYANQQAYVGMDGGTVQNATAQNVVAQDKSGIALEGCTVDGGATGVRAADKSWVKVNDTTVSNNTTALDPGFGGQIDFIGTSSLSGNTSKLPDTFRGSLKDAVNDQMIQDGVELVLYKVYTSSGGDSLLTGEMPDTSLGDRISAVAVPDTAPNTAAYRTEIVVNGGESAPRVRIVETEDSGGGNVRLFVFRDYRF